MMTATNHHLSRDQILAAPRQRRDVEVPEWGGTVTLQRMMALDYWRMQEKSKVLDWDDSVAVLAFTAEYLSLTLIDVGTGAPLFGTEDLASMQSLDPEVIDRLFGVTLELHGVRKDAIKDVEKNSGATASDDGGSASPGCAATPIPTTCSPS